jgi:hypothetical protein
MKSPYFQERIIKLLLVPFIHEHYPNGHRFQQDNDPKHTSRSTQAFLLDTINWWCTPAESPNLNPIENVWHELKNYIEKEVKPACKEELIDE